MAICKPSFLAKLAPQAKNRLNNFLAKHNAYLMYVADQAYAVNHDNLDDELIRNAVRELYPDVIHYD